MQPGFYPNLNIEEYHSSSGNSKTALSYLRKTPAHYAEKYIYRREEEKDTKALAIGKALHTLVLEPYLFDCEFAIVPMIDKRTKAGKEEWKNFSKANAGKTIIQESEYESVQAMADSVLGHPAASRLIDQANLEESFYWIHEQTGQLCKCRPDIRVPAKRILCDLKSTEDASPSGFARSIYNFSYYLQAGMCCEGVSQVLGEHYPFFIFIVVEKTPPYAVAVYQLDPEDIEKGKREFDCLIRQFAWCSKHDFWPGYPEEITPISMPGWAQPVEVELYD